MAKIREAKGSFRRKLESQQCGALHRVFILSLSLQKVPVLWRTVCLVPVPKHPILGASRTTEWWRWRPTSWRPWRNRYWPIVSPHLDPLQFAYQPWLRLEDIIIYLLDWVYTQLYQLASTVRIMFFDFSSAFNTIRPPLYWMRSWYQLQVGAHLLTWITDNLTARPQ